MSFNLLSAWILLGDNATQLNVGSNETLCLDDNPRLECMARNTSIIELSSSAYSDTVQCRKDDPPIRNLTLAGTIGHDDFGFVVKRSYSALTSVLTCSLSIEGTRFPVAINQHQLSITCLNVDIGVSRTASFIMTGILILLLTLIYAVFKLLIMY